MRRTVTCRAVDFFSDILELLPSLASPSVYDSVCRSVTPSVVRWLCLACLWLCLVKGSVEPGRKNGSGGCFRYASRSETGQRSPAKVRIVRFNPENLLTMNADMKYNSRKHSQ